MKASPLALATVIAVASSPLFEAEAFSPPSASFVASSRTSTGATTSHVGATDASLLLLLGGAAARTSRTSNLSMSSAGGFLGQDASADDEGDDEEDDDEDDDDEDDEIDLAARRRSLRSADAGEGGDAEGAFAGLTLDPYDPNPAIKPRPGRYG